MKNLNVLKATLLSVLLLLIFGSCKKDKTKPNNTNENQFVTGVPPLIHGKTPFQWVNQKFGIKTIEESGEYGTVLYTYDKDQQMIECSTRSIGDDESTYENKYTYTWRNHLLLEDKYYSRENNAAEWTLEGQMTYTYDNQGRVLTVIREEESERINTNYTYANDTITTIETVYKRNSMDSNGITKKYTYIVNGNNQIIKAQEALLQDGEWTPFGTNVSYIWNGDNLVEEKYDQGSMLYTYDSKNNFNRLVRFPMSFPSAGRNNITRKSRGNNNEEIYEYEYNSLDFPTKFKMTSNGHELTVSIKYTYHY